MPIYYGSYAIYGLEAQCLIYIMYYLWLRFNFKFKVRYWHLAAQRWSMNVKGLILNISMLHQKIILYGTYHRFYILRCIFFYPYDIKAVIGRYVNRS